MSDELLKAQIDALIRDEIQEGINEWIDDTEKRQDEAGGLGFAQQTLSETGDELTVNISNDEIEDFVREAFYDLEGAEVRNFRITSEEIHK